MSLIQCTDCGSHTEWYWRENSIGIFCKQCLDTRAGIWGGGTSSQNNGRVIRKVFVEPALEDPRDYLQVMQEKYLEQKGNNEIQEIGKGDSNTVAEEKAPVDPDGHAFWESILGIKEGNMNMLSDGNQQEVSQESVKEAPMAQENPLKEKFDKLMPKRLEVTLNDIRLIGNLSNKYSYSYSTDVLEHFQVLAEALAEVESKFLKVLEKPLGEGVFQSVLSDQRLPVDSVVIDGFVYKKSHSDDNTQELQTAS